MRTLLLAIALLLAAAYGLAAGLWTHRWQSSAERERAVARLGTVPRQIGDWQGEDMEMDRRQLAVAEIDGYLMRRYIHQASGETVQVLIVCGHPGPVSVHPPDVCYRGAGYLPQKAPQRTRFDAGEQGPSAEFWDATFQKRDTPLPDRLHIRWSWSATGAWSAPDSPRVRFARHGALYKFYLIRQVLKESAEPAEDPGNRFLGLFLPQLERHLFSDPPDGPP